MCSLSELIFCVEYHASKNNLLHHCSQQSRICICSKLILCWWCLAKHHSLLINTNTISIWSSDSSYLPTFGLYRGCASLELTRKLTRFSISSANLTSDTCICGFLQTSSTTYYVQTWLHIYVYERSNMQLNA